MPDSGLRALTDGSPQDAFSALAAALEGGAGVKAVAKLQSLGEFDGRLGEFLADVAVDVKPARRDADLAILWDSKKSGRVDHARFPQPRAGRRPPAEGFPR